MTWIVTLVTSTAMFATGVNTAFASGACMSQEGSAIPADHDHGGGDREASDPVPCEHATHGGPCAPVTLPSSTTSFSLTMPTSHIGRFAEATLPYSLDTTPVFHPPRI